VVSVNSLWVDERVYYPLGRALHLAHYIQDGKDDLAFRTKTKIALKLVEAAFELFFVQILLENIIFGMLPKSTPGFSMTPEPRV